MIRLSIIVPAEGDQVSLDATLTSVLENRPSECEVIVVCRESYIDPYALEDEVRFVRCADATGLADLLNYGIIAASGETCHWLLPGVMATDGWTAGPVRLLNEGYDFVVPVTVKGNDHGRIAGVGIRFLPTGGRKLLGKNVRVRSGKLGRLKPDAPSVSTGFCRRQSMMHSRGFCNTVHESLCDIVMAAYATQIGFGCVVDPTSILVAETDVIPRPSQFRRARDLERCFWNLDVAKSGVARHVVHALWDTLRQLPSPGSISSVIGRLAGFVSRGSLGDDIRELAADMNAPVDAADVIKARKAA